MAKYNRPNGKLFGSSATNIGVFGSGQQNETPTTSTDPNTINNLGTHWEDGWNGAVVSQAPYTAPYVEDMNAVNYVNSYNSAYLLQRGIAEYSATEEYQKDSLCTYNGEIWMCKLDNTVGQTPAEGTYWHLQGEVPIMNDNEILVGAIGGTPTVVDTNAQGDVLASASGLNIKSNTIINADINASAAIDESKLNLAYGTSSLNSTISGHIGDTANPHAVTKSQVLSGNPIVNADVDAAAAIAESKLSLSYSTSTLNTNIGTVSTNLGNHTGDTNNPHGTKISNLDDVTLGTLQDGDVMSYDLLNDTWKNGQPAGGALSTLSDTTISSPTDKQLVQYDYANSKWVNSSEVWDTIEINDIAYVGATPQGRTLDGNNNVTMLASDKRHQVLTATDGYEITLPSTGIKAGDKFVFEWSTRDWWMTMTTPFKFKAYDGTTINTNYFDGWRYEFIALQNNPTTYSLSPATGWKPVYAQTRQLYKYAQATHTFTTVVPRNEYTTNDLYSLPRGNYIIGLHWSPSIPSYDSGYVQAAKLLIKGSPNTDLPALSGDLMNNTYATNMPLVNSNVVNKSVVNKTSLVRTTSNVTTIVGFWAIHTTAAGNSVTIGISSEAILIAP